jgi:branched-chain amino acid transport system permease protein
MADRLPLVLGAIAFIVAVSVPAWANPGLVFIAGLILIQGLFATSWNVLFGYAGLASFGHAGFFGIGAYCAGALLRYNFGVPFPLILVLAMLLGAVVAWLIGLVALRRLSGIFLAVLTVALSEILRLLVSYSKFLGAEDGLSNIPHPKIDLGFAVLDFASTRVHYWFLMFVVLLALAILWWVLHSRYGRIFQIIRQDPERAAFLGTNIARYRVVAFMISGAVASLSGALYAPWTRVVTLDELHWLQSLQPMLYTLLGGVGSFWGPMIGSGAFAIINYNTREYAGVSEIIVGAVLIAIILVAPTGIVGLYHQLRGRFAKNGAGARSESGQSA